MSLQPGQLLYSRYRIVKLLGQGGFGAVYRAWDVSLNKPCAVKENLETSPEAQRQFAREATILANLYHPNLPRVTDHFSLSGQGQYLVMDFVEGEDLASMLQRQAQLPISQVLAWISQVADALSYMHSLNPPVVHRDVKPANIRITPEGRAMLVDFGLVKVYDPHLQTTLGARAVTPGYAPPEQYGHGNTDGRTDIYALGATLYKLLTRQEPLESVQRVIGKQMPSAQQLNPQVTAEVSWAIDHALRLEPSQRFQSVGEFKAALGASGPMVVKPAVEAHAAPAYRAPAAQVPPIQAPARPGAARPGRPASKPITKRKSTAIFGGGVVAILVVCLGLSLVVGGWVVSQQQAAARKTDDAHIQGTLAERVRTTSTARAQATRLSLQSALTPRPTETATSRVTEASAAETQPPESPSTLVFGPQDGSLPHQVENKSIEAQSASVDLRDFVVEARFLNPYSVASSSATEGPWDYGFVLRHEKENVQYRFVIKSNKTWVFLNNTGNPDGEILAEGQLPDLDVSKGGSNLIKLVFEGSKGWFYLNDVLITELDCSARTNSGDIYIVTGFFDGDETAGASTEYKGFTIWSIP